MPNGSGYCWSENGVRATIASLPLVCDLPSFAIMLLPGDVDHRSERGLDRALFMKLIGGDWIDAHDNLAICGPTEWDS
jgi:hypothetical protein